MGHQSNDARKALRAYARDLQSTAVRGGFASPVGTSKQDDAPNQFLGSGAPHQLAIAAAVVCVVLLGGIGLAAANRTNLPKTGLTNPATAEATSFSGVLVDSEGISTTNAIRAFNALGLTRAASALNEAAGTGTDSSPAVQQALERLLQVVSARLEIAEVVDQSNVVVSLAISDLEVAARPPGLDIAQVHSGVDTISPGLDDVWLEQMRNRGNLSPSEAPSLIPPGHLRAEPPGNGRDTAPGQAKEKPKKGEGKP